MEELYLELMEYLEQHVQDLGLSALDEDYGQLEAMLNGEDGYPIAFPALLIAFGEVQWDVTKPVMDQRGQLLVSTRLAFDCYDDTHLYAGQREYAHERYEAARTLHGRMRGLRLASIDSSPLLRVASRTVALPRGIKVYETDYRIRITEPDPAAPDPRD